MVFVTLGACGAVPAEPLPDAAETTPDAAPDAAPETLWDVSAWDDPVAVWGP